MNRYDYQSEWVKGPKCAPALRRLRAQMRPMLSQYCASWPTTLPVVEA